MVHKLAAPVKIQYQKMCQVSTDYIQTQAPLSDTQRRTHETFEEPDLFVSCARVRDLRRRGEGKKGRKRRRRETEGKREKRIEGGARAEEGKRIER